MENERVFELLSRQISGDITPAETAELNLLKESSRENKDLYDDLTSKWEKSANYKVAIQPDTEKSWEQFVTKVEGGATQRIIPLFIRVAALIVIGLVVGYYYFTLPTRIEITSGKGQKREVILPDGSKVTLNQLSSLSYASDFNGEDRELNFKGNAFFEVAKNPEKPFLIFGEKINIQVLGTSFDVDAYRKDFVEVNVMSGKVAMREKGEKAEVILTAGMTGSYSNQKLTALKSSGQNYHSWLSGKLVFANTPLHDLVEDLKRNFGQEIVLMNAKLGDCRFTGSFQDQTLEEILEIVSASLSLTASTREGRFVLDGPGC
jgi:transmembrane sensor